MVNKINIAISGKDFVKWTGGSDFLCLITRGLHSLNNIYNLNLYLLLPSNLKDKLISSNNHLIKLFNELDYNILFYNDNEEDLISCLRNIDANVLMPSFRSPGDSFTVPWVGYLFDLQHKYFPEYFSIEELNQRDINFKKMLTEAKAIIVNSQNAKDDINKFFQNHNCQIFNLPFAPLVEEKWLNPNSNDLKIKYQLPEKYFIISNQFWIHKSHITAFKALKELEITYSIKDLHIVCTGKNKDYRFPDYFSELTSQIDQLGLSDKIHFLGLIPKDDQIGIMKDSIAAIQPTLFEGGPGGGSVYDAISIGVPSIVSDIPVNLEIKDDNVYFFTSKSYTNLAKKMFDLYSSSISRLTAEELINKSRQREIILGKRLIETGLYVINYT